MRGRRSNRRNGGLAASVAASVALAALASALAGCGRSNDAGSARERDETRDYGRVVARSEVSPRRVTLGDPVVWTLTATLPASTVPEAVQLAPTPAGLEIVPRGEAAIRPARGAIVWSRVYDLRGFDLVDLATQVANVEATGVADSQLFHLAEQWRTRLIEDDAAATEFPGGNAEPLPRLITDARRERDTGRPPGAKRALFRHVLAALRQGR